MKFTRYIRTAIVISAGLLLGSSAYAKSAYETNKLKVEVVNSLQSKDVAYAVKGLLNQRSDGQLSGVLVSHQKQDVHYWRVEETADIILAEVTITDPSSPDKVIWQGATDFDLIDNQASYIVKKSDSHYKVTVDLKQPTPDVGPFFKVTVQKVS